MHRKNRIWFVLLASLLFLAIACRSSTLMEREARTLHARRAPRPWNDRSPRTEYYLHKKIKTTYFYIGQKNRAQAGFLNNGSSAWTGDWVGAYGGTDLSHNRRGFFPRDFRPKENPFYCALPFNDVTLWGHKPKSFDIIPWARAMEKNAGGEFISYCKNRWVKITYKSRACYAQWEDVRPFQTDDRQYVFGTDRPKNRRNGGVGLDVSPACFAYLGMKDNGNTDWQFVEFEDVPDGPWLRVVTTSRASW